LLARTYAVTWSGAPLWPPVSRSWAQLVYALRGVLTITAEAGVWILPPFRAVWLPANVPCRLEVKRQTALRMIYLRKNAFRERRPGFDPSTCAVVGVSPLLKELILRTVAIGSLLKSDPHHRRLCGLIWDELTMLSSDPLQLPFPQSSPARAFANALTRDSPVPFDIPSALRVAGASRRTIERYFRRETGMSLGEWVRRSKVLVGLERLLGGETVASTAFRLGYSGPSAFIALFRRELGCTPGAYLSAGR